MGIPLSKKTSLTFDYFWDINGLKIVLSSQIVAIPNRAQRYLSQIGRSNKTKFENQTKPKSVSMYVCVCVLPFNFVHKGLCWWFPILYISLWMLINFIRWYSILTYFVKITPTAKSNEKKRRRRNHIAHTYGVYDVKTMLRRKLVLKLLFRKVKTH